MQAKKITLKNGLRLILVPQRGAPTATVLVLVGTGSEYETKRINGVAHFLEHMVFKGTTSRPKAGMIAEELDSLGAEYNAFTSQEHTGYWAKAGKQKAGQLLDLVSDLYLHPLFEQKEIEKERGVIIEEINMYEDMPQRNVWDVFSELVYGDQPAGWNIAGKKEIIQKMKRNDFVDFRKRFYVPERTVVVMAGGFEEAEIKKSAKQLFEGLPRKSAPKKIATKEFQRAPRMVVKHKTSDQSHIVIGVRAFPVSDERRHIIEVLGGVLGGGMSSRLFHRIREELGAAYYVRAGEQLSVDHGFFAISAGANHGKLQDVVQAIIEECERLKHELVGEKELKKVKGQITSSLMMGLETSDELASFYGGQEIMMKKMTPPEELSKKIEKVSAEAVRALAKTLFTNANLNFAMVGPDKDGAKLKKLLKFRK